MASTTTNIGLTKPAGTDQALISAINGNMDIIDTKMGAVGNTSVQSQITSLSDQIANIPKMVLGNQTLTLTVTATSRPTGFLIVCYKEMWIVSEASSSANLELTRLTDGTGATLSVSGRTITFGTDANRAYFCFLPSGFTLS